MLHGGPMRWDLGPMSSTALDELALVRRGDLARLVGAWTTWHTSDAVAEKGSCRFSAPDLGRGAIAAPTRQAKGSRPARDILPHQPRVWRRRCGRPAATAIKKAAHRAGERRISLMPRPTSCWTLSRSADAEDRLVAARFLCSCHVRGRTEDMWEAIVALMSDEDAQVSAAPPGTRSKTAASRLAKACWSGSRRSWRGRPTMACGSAAKEIVGPVPGRARAPATAPHAAPRASR